MCIDPLRHSSDLPWGQDADRCGLLACAAIRAGDVIEERERDRVDEDRVALRAEALYSMQHGQRKMLDHGIRITSGGAQIAHAPQAALVGHVIECGSRELEAGELEWLVDLRDRLGTEVEDEDAAVRHWRQPHVPAVDP